MELLVRCAASVCPQIHSYERTCRNGSCSSPYVDVGEVAVGIKPCLLLRSVESGNYPTAQRLVDENRRPPEVGFVAPGSASRCLREKGVSSKSQTLAENEGKIATRAGAAHQHFRWMFLPQESASLNTRDPPVGLSSPPSSYNNEDIDPGRRFQQQSVTIRCRWIRRMKP